MYTFLHKQKVNFLSSSFVAKMCKASKQLFKVCKTTFMVDLVDMT